MSTTADTSNGDISANDESPLPRPTERLRAHVSLHKKFFIVLGIIVFAGLTVRVANVLLVRKTVGHPTSNDYMVNGDAFYYHWQAVAIGEGQFFVNPARRCTWTRSRRARPTRPSTRRTSVRSPRWGSTGSPTTASRRR